MFWMEVIHQNQHYTGNLLLAFCHSVKMYFEIPQNQFFVPWKQEESKKRRNTLFQEVGESGNTVKCYHKDKIPRAFTLRKKLGNLISIRNNT